MQIDTLYDKNLTFRYSCEEGNVNLVKLLLNKNSVTDKETIQIGFLAGCKNGCTDLVKWILKNSEIKNNILGAAFYIACKNGYFKIAELLLDDEINMISVRTAFITCCENGYLERAKWILRKYPKLNIRSSNDMAFRISCSSGHFEIIKWLYKKNPEINIGYDKNHAFFWSCINGNIKIAKWLLKQKPDIDVKDSKIFVTSFINGHVKIIRWLLFLVPDISLRYEDEYILKICGAKNYIELAKLFLKIRPNMDAINIQKAIESGCQNGNMEIVKWLLQKHPEINYDYDAIFFNSCKGEYLNILIWLIGMKPEINIHANNEMAIQNSYRNHHYQVMEWLIEKVFYHDTRYIYHENVLYIINPKEKIKKYMETVINNCKIYSSTIPDILLLTEYMHGLTVKKSARTIIEK
jgi:ankyrin repeat protein